MKVVTYNVKDGGHQRGRLILEVLATLQGDLVLLQEVRRADVAQAWAEQLGMQCLVAQGHSRRHVALLSRFPIHSYASHTPVRGLSRDFLSARIEYRPGQILTVLVAHLAAQPFIAYEWLCLLEIHAILRNAITDSSIPCLLGGDLNSVSAEDRPSTKRMPWFGKGMLLLQGNRYSHHVISAIRAAAFFDCFRLLHIEPGYTLPPPHPTIRFDYLFANAALKVTLRDCFVARQPSAVDGASDHYPLVAEFTL